MTTTTPRKCVSVFALTMLNIATILSIKNWPFMAEQGFASLFFLLLALFAFFIPCALVAAELATGWPLTGGIYCWVKEAFGHRFGFLASWLLWVENLAWYPTTLSFIAGTLAFAFKPSIATNQLYIFAVVFATIWGVTAINLFGLRAVSILSSIGVIVGTFIPGILIIGLGIAWLFQGQHMNFVFSWNNFIPQFNSPMEYAFFAGILLSFGGIELSAIHAKDVYEPKKNYPKAILTSGLIITFMTLLGTLSIASVVPKETMSLTSGGIEAIGIFLRYRNMEFLIPLIAFLMTLGALGTVSSWIVGPTRALLIVAKDGDLPPIFHTSNRHGMPVGIMIFQAICVTALSFVFLYFPSVNTSFWALIALSAQLYLLMYILMFVTALVLRYKRPDVVRSYTIPGKNVGIWICSILGISSCIAGFIAGFIPPTPMKGKELFSYEAFLVGGIVILCLIPNLILFFKSKKWSKP